MSTHTPGPWVSTVETRTHGGWRDPTQHVEIYAGETLVADYSTAYVEYPDDPENEANARLIAAAPDMLAALKTAEDAITHLHVRSFSIGGKQLGDILLDAINKAEA